MPDKHLSSQFDADLNSLSSRLLEMGGEINNSSPAEFQKVIDAEVKNWAEAVKLSGARVD